MAIQNSNRIVNEVVKIVEDETIVRSNFKSVSDVYSRIEEYGRTSDTKWNLRSSRPSGTRLVCCGLMGEDIAWQRNMNRWKKFMGFLLSLCHLTSIVQKLVDRCVL
ncbi:hypothetical protein AVEN_77086-1 [Araneus ventricosus]|uniref:Uncharacterized protein n=1 Tax=Araneus ventricosus TaxID=182803 RepID=A0A4Y2LF24_ARAVE|nr:hypothetical protein AVEN_77086-1 [Araneus ventricosus]